MSNVLERKPRGIKRAFRAGFIQGVGGIGQILVAPRLIRSKRSSLPVSVSRGDWETDWRMIKQDFAAALDKLNARTNRR